MARQDKSRSDRGREESSAGKPAGRMRKVWKGILFTSLVLITLIAVGSVATVGAAAGYVASLVKDEPVRDKEEIKVKITSWTQTSHAYFRDGTPIGKLSGGEDRKVVTTKEVSPLLIDALLSTEDREFYTHNGIVPKSLMRAGYQMVSGAEIQTGGSTITQQLVKNLFLDYRQRNMDRKAKEIFLAMRMERLFSKEDILNAYLNSVYFGKNVSGRNMLGVQAAAKGIFDVDAKDLNLPQAAYIAGMVQRPNAYNPFRGEKNLENGKRRMKQVLRNMVENGKISEAEYRKAAAYDVKGAIKTKDDTAIAFRKYPFITMAVEEEAAKVLMKVDGKDAKKLSKQGKYRDTLDKYQQKVLTGGYKITTTLDEKLYNAMNEASRNTPFADSKEEVGAVLLDVKTGGTLAFVGGRDYNKNQKNHALDMQRQPGSSIKPLLDFGPALDRGVISPDSIIIDEPLSAGGKTYRNYTHRYDGAMTAREALAKSINIPAIKMLRSIGIQTGFKYLRKMNFPIHEYDGESSAIGGFTYGFDVQRITAGYAMLGNQGKFNEPYMISKIEDSNGKVIYEHKSEPVQVLSPRAAYWTTDMLKDVVRKGTGTLVGKSFPGYHLAGKTGTTNSTKDVWFVGYTPDVALGVWTGYDYPKRIPNDKRARYVWINLFRAAVKTDPKLISGAGFPAQPAYPFKCYECNRVKKEEKKEEKEEKREGQTSQPSAPQQPSNQREEQRDRPPGNEGDNGHGQPGTPNPPPNEGDPQSTD
ncbi:penicillin-binding protein 1B [Kroppenstedtia guangzhouensis]|uniref:Penicillin-binding protein 1B n=1 Tax=Kroppenstedtia guangzhouensis TaxID=1274356 RepID=A0ABQ1G3F7_9BACL|nr:transglycosylase domain-containing protein [Kroppenstedtia guangzhouensis]GGA36735.1 penicillin-binding protein 1B [Kroppenstedtia guangzhouensis]